MSALNYLQGKADNDHMFFLRYLCTNDGKLMHPFLAGGTIPVDFQYFGDVLAFDTTYKKNKYKKHHSQIVIFVYTLVADETIDIYK